MKEQILAGLTVGEFVDALTERGLVIVKNQPEARPQDSPAALDFSDSSRYGCGLSAIMTRYGVRSTRTAQKLKDGVLAPAIYQAERRGRFWIDFETADAIMKERKARRGEKVNAQTVTA